MTNRTARFTTAEVAEELGCEAAEALALLRAAGVRSTRAGRRGMHLWDGVGVQRLLVALGKSDTAKSA